MSVGARRLERYLLLLPDGLASHPDCKAKGVLVRDLLADEQNRRALAAVSPGPLLDLVNDPPMATEWVPEVHAAALLLAAADLRQLPDDAVVAQARVRDAAMLASPAYSPMLSGKSPARLLRMSGALWGSFHRGSTLEVEGIADDGVHLGLRYPLGLFDRLRLRCMAGAFAAALELARAQAPSVEVREVGLGHARYLARWEE